MIRFGINDLVATVVALVGRLTAVSAGTANLANTSNRDSRCSVLSPSLSPPGLDAVTASASIYLVGKAASWVSGLVGDPLRGSQALPA